MAAASMQSLNLSLYFLPLCISISVPLPSLFSGTVLFSPSHMVLFFLLFLFISFIRDENRRLRICAWRVGWEGIWRERKLWKAEPWLWPWDLAAGNPVAAPTLALGYIEAHLTFSFLKVISSPRAITWPLNGSFSSKTQRRKAVCIT